MHFHTHIIFEKFSENGKHSFCLPEETSKSRIHKPDGINHNVRSSRENYEIKLPFMKYNLTKTTLKVHKGNSLISKF